MSAKAKDVFVRVLRGWVMENKDGVWAGSIGRALFWMSFGTLFFYTQVKDDGIPPDWCWQAFEYSLGYNLGGKVLEAVKKFKK